MNSLSTDDRLSTSCSRKTFCFNPSSLLSCRALLPVVPVLLFTGLLLLLLVLLLLLLLLLLLSFIRPVAVAVAVLALLLLLMVRIGLFDLSLPFTMVVPLIEDGVLMMGVMGVLLMMVEGAAAALEERRLVLGCRGAAGFDPLEEEEEALRVFASILLLGDDGCFPASMVFSVDTSCFEDGSTMGGDDDDDAAAATVARPA